MKTYKVTLAYDGTNYHGWQIQPKMITISQAVQDIFRSVFKKNIKIIGASRTDSGVHALGQVAMFKTDLDLELSKMRNAWLNRLPKDILIRKLELAADDFHPQVNVAEKTYLYHFVIKRPLPFLSNYVYFSNSTVFDCNKLIKALNIFVGTHDFRSFCTGNEKENTVRTISSIKLNYFAKFGVYQLVVKGQSFLHHMIRRIVGASLDIAASTVHPIEELSIALEKRDPHQHFKTAPSCGLMLYKIKYSD